MKVPEAEPAAAPAAADERTEGPSLRGLVRYFAKLGSSGFGGPLARQPNKRGPVAGAIAAVLCATTAISGAEIIWLVLLAGVFGAFWWGGGLPSSRGAASLAPAASLNSVKGFALTGSGASLA